MRRQHCLDHADNIQKPAKSSDCLLGVVTQPTNSRLSETSFKPVETDRQDTPDISDDSDVEPSTRYCCAVMIDENLAPGASCCMGAENGNNFWIH